MSCSPFDLRDYVFGELDSAQARSVETHGRQCASCADELARLRITETALFSLREEEMPRRIAFVSDQVMTPHIWEARWWHAWWNSAPRLGFASAAMLSMAILAHALIERPAAPPAPVAPVVTAQVDQTLIDQKVAVAVAQAVANLEAQQQTRLASTVQQVDKRYSALRQEDLMTLEANFNLNNQKQKARYISLMREANAFANGGVQ